MSIDESAGSSEASQCLRECADLVDKMLGESQEILDEILGCVPVASSDGIQKAVIEVPKIIQLQIMMQSNCAKSANLRYRLIELKNKI
jgi:hypothetical protein